MPGGHAPMIDFVDNPYLGELLNTLHEDGVLIWLSCHAPVAMVSATYRVAGDGPQAIDDQAAKLRQLLDIATQRGRPATTRTPA
jgi:putative intracellular protease/amidase